MHITVIGMGYVGMVTAVGLAMLGHTVHCVDIDAQKIQSLTDGHCPIYEKNIEERLRQLSSNTLLTFGTHYRCTDRIFFLTVGTPPLEDGDADLSQLFFSIAKIIEFAPDHSLIVVKSTVPVGTNKKIVSYLKENNRYDEVVSNPEFLREGHALDDFLNPDRIVIGVHNSYGKDMLTKIYQPFIDKGCYTLITDPNTAELIKHASNAFLASKIAFINELSDFCEKAQADIDDLSLGVGLDKRIGPAFLKVGPGFGGSCFPKDIRSLNRSFNKYGIQSKILESVMAANEYRFENVVNKILKILGGVQNKILCVYGLTFKAHTDDTRGSPALRIIELLVAQNAMINCYDPKANYDLLQNDYNQSINFYNNPEESMCDAHALIIATEWEEFKNINFDRIKISGIMKSNIVIDLRNILDINLMQRKGFQYYCLGKAIQY
ncbi:UDP-glucose dehydrogenase family protein [Candidatus Cardinium hertigii]|jgi:UDPglucose 6-dehydrogenase|uniref:UDP-glucose 6-dehydrogenase n=1 Tax=Candidatus Cardinium hertigii TaxID=247481 RepID=A0A3N2QC33_9BACT|nr:UDP-glucose/GDP-mannose dehydrogenase family protein [Candidatus Cardinium hertigii]ROT47383.1 UDP-glucose/GDP-mannose dehydrogenase family protein [Candidatus Cardinium hertigii]